MEFTFSKKLSKGKNSCFGAGVFFTCFWRHYQKRAIILLNRILFVFLYWRVWLKILLVLVCCCWLLQQNQNNILKQFKEGRVYFSFQFKGKSTLMGEAWWRHVRHLDTLHPQSGRREQWMLVLSSLFFIQFRTSAHGMVPPAAKVGLATSVHII